MPLQFSPKYWHAYKQLSPSEQRQVDSHLLLLDENHRHPSLRARRWDADTWYARVSRDLRVFYEVHEGFYFVKDVGHHDIERSL